MNEIPIKNYPPPLLIISLLLFCNCFIYSTYQTATLLAPDQKEIVPIADIQYSWWDRMGNGHWMINSGTRLHYGLSRNVNVGGTFLVRYNPPENNFKSQYRSYAEIDIKFPIIRRNRLALSVPIGIDWPYTIDETAILFSPTMLFSFPFTDRFSLTTSLRLSGYILICNGYPGTIPFFTPFVAVNGEIRINQQIVLCPSVGIAIGEGIASVGGGIGIRISSKHPGVIKNKKLSEP